MTCFFNNIFHHAPRRTSVVLAMALAIASVSVQAETVRWTGEGPGPEWGEYGANWDTGSVPVSEDTVIIDDISLQTPLIIAETVETAVLGIGVVDTGALIIDGSGGPAGLVNGSGAFVGSNSGSSGTLTLSDGGTFTNGGELYIGDSANSAGTVSVTGSGSTLTNVEGIGRIRVGVGGTGSLDISAGGSVEGLWIYVAEHLSATGDITVTGSGSTLDATNGVAIGLSSSETLNSKASLTLGDGGALNIVSPDVGVQLASPEAELNIGAAAGEPAVAPGVLDSPVAVVHAGTLVFNHTGANYAFAPEISGDGAVSVLSGTTTFTAGNTYTGGTTVSSGTLRIGDGATAGAIAGDVVNDSELIFDRADALTFGGTISGAGRVEHEGTGTLTLTGDNTHTGGTTIHAGTLELGDGGTSGMVAGNVVNEGMLAFHRADAVTFDGDVGGSGAVAQIGGGATTLTGAWTHAGDTTVEAGALLVEGSIAGATVVHDGGRLGGSGTLGPVTVQAGGTLAPGTSAGTLTTGDLTLDSGAVLEFELDAPGGNNDRVAVAGDLVLNGTLNVADLGGLGTGSYRLFDYSGTLSDQGVAVGSLPAGFDATINTATAGEVDLVVVELLPTVDLSPAALDFGGVDLGQTGAAQTVILENTGDGNLNPGTLALGGTDAGDFALAADTCSGQVIAPDGQCAFDVTFSPTGTGARTARVDVSSDAPSSPDTVALSGNGLQAVLDLSKTVSAINGDAQRAVYSEVGDVIDFEITAVNDGNVTLTGVTVSDTQLGVFDCTWPGTAGILDMGESVECTGSYTVIQDDLDTGEVVNEATADSNETEAVNASLTVAGPDIFRDRFENDED